MVEKYDNLIAKSVGVEGINVKKKVVIEKISDKNTKQVKITKEQIELFIKYSKLPIPINLQENFKYYIDLFEPYYDIEIFNYFINDIKTIRYGQIKSDISKVKNEIINLLKSNLEYKSFISNESLSPIYPNNFMD